jgi:hypothetical protein
MKKLIILFTLLLLVIGAPLSAVKDKSYTAFSKGVSYILLGDREFALRHLDDFFNEYQDPPLRSIFVDLIKNNNWEVTKDFKRYLDLNHRSIVALVGIALSTTDMQISTSIFNLERAQRLDGNFSPIYLCLGVEYMKQQNYPRAEYYFNQALRTRWMVPEYKIMMAQLYLLRNEPSKILALVKPEADQQPDNFYFNYYTALAYFQLGQIDSMARYVQTAQEVGPTKNEAQLLMGKYLLAKNQLKQAKNILRRLKYRDYNEDYSTTYAEVLLKLNDRKAKSLIDEVYFKNRWNKDINRLMGQHHAASKRTRENTQNWINRAILSGNSIDQLKKLFPGNYTFQDYNYLSFFDVWAVKWISDDLIVVGARKASGDTGKLFFIQPQDLKVLNVLSYNGELLDIFLSQDRDKIIFSTAAKKGESIYLYAVEGLKRSFSLKLLYPKPLPLASVDVGFNRSGTLAYITDSRLARLAFESPFSIVPQIGDKIPVYSTYPFYLYQYNFPSQRFGMIKDMDWLDRVPIPSVKRYYMVREAAGTKSSIQGLIERGQRLDLTSSEIVKVFFSSDLSSFIIYLSDLKNAFQAILYESLSNTTRSIDETMFLGKDQYAELTMLDYDPGRREILVMTKDENRDLIKFNYDTRLYINPTDKVCEIHYDRESNQAYALTERSKKSLFTETNLEIISFNPFYKTLVDTRRDLEKVLFNIGGMEVYFSTFNGELLLMDSEYKFHYLGPNFDGCLHEMSPSKKKTAAYINGRLYVLNGPIKEQTRKALLKKRLESEKR